MENHRSNSMKIFLHVSSHQRVCLGMLASSNEQGAFLRPVDHKVIAHVARRDLQGVCTRRGYFSNILQSLGTISVNIAKRNDETQSTTSKIIEVSVAVSSAHDKKEPPRRNYVLIMKNLASEGPLCFMPRPVSSLPHLVMPCSEITHNHPRVLTGEMQAG